MSLEKFVEDYDADNFGSPANQDRLTTTYLSSHGDISHLHVENSYSRISQLHDELEKLKVTNSESLRPSWDSYFMVSPHGHLCNRRLTATPPEVGLPSVSPLKLHETSCWCYSRPR